MRLKARRPMGRLSEPTGKGAEAAQPPVSGFLCCLWPLGSSDKTNLRKPSNPRGCYLKGCPSAKGVFWETRKKQSALVEVALG